MIGPYLDADAQALEEHAKVCKLKDAAQHEADTLRGQLAQAQESGQSFKGRMSELQAQAAALSAAAEQARAQLAAAEAELAATRQEGDAERERLNRQLGDALQQQAAAAAATEEHVALAFRLEKQAIGMANACVACAVCLPWASFSMRCAVA